MNNIHILPTDKPSRLTKNNSGKFFKLNGLQHQYVNENQNIYITSNEKPNLKDWFYLDDAGLIAKYIDIEPVNEAKKIILTTDPELIADGVQAIDDDFLEWFVKNPSCTRVEVSYEQDENGVFHHVIWGMHFKEDLPNQETLEEAAERIAKEHCNNRVNPNTTEFQVQQFIIKGAKWQYDRIPSIINEFLNQYGDNISAQIMQNDVEEWFEQFKKNSIK